ncbi:translation initiation factor [Rhodococcus rhodnii]|nr:translation initiation factor [Rhodococcus rhodnii]TXG89962.1 translation initiation factor [Rhodococcus rhodnii]
MPPRTRTTGRPPTLTRDELDALSAALAEGRRATVYLRDAITSLGIEAGTSAKVVSIDGTSVLVRPKGVDDELPFEPDELHARRPAAPQQNARAKAEPAAHQELEPAPKKPASPKPATPKPAAPKPVPAAAASTPAPRAARRKAPASVSVTIHADAAGEWSVTVAQGAKRPSKATPVSPDAVERAIGELDVPAVADAVADILAAARNAAALKVDELTEQLEQARRALDALGGKSQASAQ